MILMAVMSTFGERLKLLFKEKHTNQRQVALKGGISVDTMRRLTQKETSEGVRPATFEAIAEAMKMPVEELHELLESDGLPSGFSHNPLAKPDFERKGWIPKLGKAAAGDPTDYELNVLGDRDVPGTLYHAPQELPATIVAHGDSMSSLIESGDIVVIARKFWRPPQTGDIVAVSIVQEKGHSLKHLTILADGRWQLSPHNPRHIPRTYEPSQIKASAVVVGWYHPVHKPRPTKR